jgi:hypothetical protein
MLLNNWLVRNGGVGRLETTASAEGPQHMSTWTVISKGRAFSDCRMRPVKLTDYPAVDGVVYGVATGVSRAAAAEHAAYQVLRRLFM